MRANNKGVRFWRVYREECGYYLRGILFSEKWNFLLEDAISLLSHSMGEIV